jgi:hypothetical protein
MGEQIMGIPSPFEVARHTGNNLNKAFSRVKDENAIERILSDVIQTDDPVKLQNTIGKILSQVSPERQGAAIQYLQNAYANVQKSKEQERVRQGEMEAGVTPGLHPTVQAQQLRNQQPPKPTKPLGGLSGQAVPDEIAKKIPDILEKNKNSSADELAVSFDEAKIPRAYSNSYIENRRRQDETKAANQREDKKVSRNEELQFHKESEKYDEDLLKQARVAKGQAETLVNIENAIQSGNIKPTSWANIFKGFGKIGDKISEALLNKDEATLLTSIPQLLEGWKDVFGVRLTDADLRLLQDKLPSIGKSPDANNAVIKILKKYSDMTLLRNQIAEEIKEKSKGLRPLGYATQVEQRFDEMTAPVKIVNPNNGKVIEIPAYKLSDALRSGAKLANE